VFIPLPMADKTQSKCVVCNKTVYAMEKVSIDGKSLHESCFKCAQCKKKLSPGSYKIVQDTFYCQAHYAQHSEKEKPGANWAPSTATYETPSISKPAAQAPSSAAAKPAAQPAATKPAAQPAATKPAAQPAAAAKPAAQPAAKPPATAAAKPATQPAAAAKPPATAAKPAAQPAAKPPATAAKPGGPPPPPAPPPADFFVTDSSAPDPGNTDTNSHAAALAAIASGGHNLKHVSKEDRKRKPVSSVVPGDAKPKPAAAPTTSSTHTGPKKGTPETKLEGLKWTVRFIEGKQDPPLVITITDMKQSVSISDCSKSVIIVKGKVTNVSVMNSEGCGVIFDDIIASAEVVRCQKMQLQANGKIAQICIDKTNGCDLFIQSEVGKDVEIVTSLTDAVNINFPGPTEDSDLVEFPVPAQFESVLKGGKLVTVAVSHV